MNRLNLKIVKYKPTANEKKLFQNAAIEVRASGRSPRAPFAKKQLCQPKESTYVLGGSQQHIQNREACRIARKNPSFSTAPPPHQPLPRPQDTRPPPQHSTWKLVLA